MRLNNNLPRVLILVIAIIANLASVNRLPARAENTNDGNFPLSLPDNNAPPRSKRETGVLNSVFGGLIGAGLTSTVSILIFVIIAKRKEQKQNAFDLMESFINDESYIKARLISQKYLLPSGPHYSKYEDLNYEEINVALSKGNEEQQEAAFSIRAIPGFFWLVDQAWQRRSIRKGETIFLHHYAWYYVFIIEKRIKGCKDTGFFRKFDWMCSRADEQLMRDKFATEQAPFLKKMDPPST